jgi:MFS family permease
MMDGIALDERLKRENVTAFCCGLVLFSLATNVLFTPLPIFVNNITVGLPAGVVFAIFMLNSSGAIAGYALAGSRSGQSSGKPNIGRLVLVRSLLAFILLAALQQSLFSVSLTIGVLILMAFVFAVFMVNILSLSMELIPAGKVGLINVLAGIGGACGSFAGPLIAQALGFLDVFIVAGVIFFAAFVSFRLFA